MCGQKYWTTQKKRQWMFVNSTKKKHEFTFTYIAVQNIDENNNRKFGEKFNTKKNFGDFFHTIFFANTF